MKYLIDTHILIWLAISPEKISKDVLSVTEKNWMHLESCMAQLQVLSDRFVELESSRIALSENIVLAGDRDIAPVLTQVRGKLQKSKIENHALNEYIKTTRKFLQGVFDSVVVEYPSDKILEALADFYGDDFPFKEGNGYDVRQAIVLAQLTFPRDDSEGYSELGLPIQVVVGSYIDSLGTEIRRMEEYKPNRKLIAESGHPNMVFYDGDSVSLQVTYGMRDLINQAKNGRNFKMMVRLGWPVLQATDSTYRNHVVKDSTTGKTDTSYVFLDHFDYARYDFGKSFSQPATLKLWLATKRGGEE